MKAADYHADAGSSAPSLSYSIAKILLSQSCYHAWLAHPRLNPDYVPDDDEKFDIGQASHDLLLEGGTPRICVINPEDYRSKPTKADPEGSIPKGWTNGAIRAARAEAKSNGLTPILPWENAKIRKMKEAALAFIAQSEIAGIFDSGAAEQTLKWQEGETHFRSRLDWLSGDKRVILDYKTSASAEPRWFSRQIANMGYDLQAAFYLRGLTANGHQNAQFILLAQEVDPPHACSLHGIAPSMMEIAQAKAEHAIAIWRRCIATNVWPAYDNRVHWSEATAWQMADMEEMVNG